MSAANVRTPAEVRALILESFSDLRARTEVHRDTIEKLIKGMDQADPNWASTQDLHRVLSKAMRTLDAAIDELARGDDDEDVQP
jgi:predicted transcriptional regulator